MIDAPENTSPTERRRRHPLILVPVTCEDGLAEHRMREPIRHAQAACRVAHQLKYTPVCPLLIYGSFLSAGEYMMEAPQVLNTWLPLVDRIWLQYDPSATKLDGATFDILDNNEVSDTRLETYKLALKENEFYPVKIPRIEIETLLAANLTAILNKQYV